MRELEKEIEGGGGDRRERDMRKKVRKVGGRIIRERKNGEKRVIRGLKKERKIRKKNKTRKRKRKRERKGKRKISARANKGRETYN